MSSSDGPVGSEARPVRTTGLGSDLDERDGEEDADGGEARSEADRLRERVAELEDELDRKGTALEARETRIAALTDELETTRRERDDARQWAAFLDRELSEHRDRVETLEDRVEALESRGLLGRLRGLLGR